MLFNALKVWKWGFVKSKKVRNQIEIWTHTPVYLIKPNLNQTTDDVLSEDINNHVVISIWTEWHRKIHCNIMWIWRISKRSLTCPEHSHWLSKSTYSPSLLYMPRAVLVSLPSSSCRNLSLAMLSNSLDKWRCTCDVNESQCNYIMCPEKSIKLIHYIKCFTLNICKKKGRISAKVQTL